MLKKNTHPASTASVEQLHAAQAQRIDGWGRLYITILLLIFALLLARVVQLKTSPDPRLEQADGTSISTRTALGKRGDIFDRRGRVLATSTMGYRLFLDPQIVPDIDTIAVDLAHLIDEDPVAIDRKIIPRRDRRYVVIDHLLEGWQVDAIRRANLPGVGLKPRLVRHYPNDPVGAALIGRVGFEHDGLSGLEYTFNDTLAPSHGKLTYLRDAHRQALWIDPDGYTPKRDGRPVRISLDLVIQETAERRVRQAVEQYNAGGGRLVAINCRTGEILAMVDVLNTPEGREAVTADPMRDKHPSLGRNRCVSDPYEPGSTFKPFAWSVATELEKATLDEQIPTPASGYHITSEGRPIRDVHGRADATWREVLIHSMNSGMAIVAERLSHKQMQSVLRRFNFGEKTYCGLPGESPGIITSPNNWNHYTQTSVAMGHEIAVTPVQTVRAFSAFARDGTLVELRVTAPDEKDAEYQLIDRAVSESTAKITRQTMRQVITEGTGRKAQSDRYKIFGKSGTAQLPNREEGGYYENRYVSSFIAGAPLDDPRVIVLCVIDDPDRSISHWGGVVAAPVVKDVIEHTLSYLGVPSDVLAKGTK